MMSNERNGEIALEIDELLGRRNPLPLYGTFDDEKKASSHGEIKKKLVQNADTLKKVKNARSFLYQFCTCRTSSGGVSIILALGFTVLLVNGAYYLLRDEQTERQLLDSRTRLISLAEKYVDATCPTEGYLGKDGSLGFFLRYAHKQLSQIQDYNGGHSCIRHLAAHGGACNHPAWFAYQLIETLSPLCHALFADFCLEARNENYLNDYDFRLNLILILTALALVMTGGLGIRYCVSSRATLTADDEKKIGDTIAERQLVLPRVDGKMDVDTTLEMVEEDYLILDRSEKEKVLSLFFQQCLPQHDAAVDKIILSYLDLHGLEAKSEKRRWVLV